MIYAKKQTKIELILVLKARAKRYFSERGVLQGDENS